MHLKSHKASQRIAGFTLLEVLIALFIFTIVAMIMTHALRSVFDSQHTTEQRAAQLAELQLAMLLLSQDMEQAIDRPIKNAARETEPALLGTAKQIALTHGGLANPGGQLPRSTLQRTRYEVSNHRLLRQSWEVLDQVPTSKPHARLLLSNVTAFRADYLDDENHYNDRWPPANKPKAAVFPRAVKISLTLAYWGTITQVYLMPGNSLATPTP